VLRSFRGVLPRVHPTAFIDESAQVIGDVEIGEESSVWMGVVVRGDVNRIRIGRRTNVQDGTIVHVMIRTHPTTIGDSVTIGHGAIVHGCTIEDQCLLGMGAILLNGSHIGTQSIVAAGTLVTEEMKVPPRSLVMGSPAKVRRLLTQAEIAEIQGYADRYVGYRLDYMRPV
jgi:carbonic anhydrase/acetyltransferase-like protein (isoleucine patch superfamily)